MMNRVLNIIDRACISKSDHVDDPVCEKLISGVGSILTPS